MTTPPAQHWDSIRAYLSLISAGSGVTGKSPTAVVQRLSDSLYLQADGVTWASATFSHPMAEVDAVDEPGLYSYTLAAAALDYDAGFPGYFFILTEATTPVLEHKVTVPLRRSAWDDVRTDHQTSGTFGEDFALLSLTTVGAEGDITLTIVDGSSNPVEGALVRIFDVTGTRLVARAYTDAFGQITAGLPVGTYKVRTYKGGFDFTTQNPTTVSVVPNTDVVPQLDEILPTSASLGDKIVLHGRFFGTDTVKAVFGADPAVDVDAVNADGTVALVTIPLATTGTVVPVRIQKPDPSNPPLGVLQSNPVTLTIV